MREDLRVLIVEDSPDDTLLLLRALETAGFDVVHERVETEEAMDSALARRRWDIVISDYNMPRFDAPAALALLRRRTPDIPFIIVSGSIGEESAVAALKAGAQDFFVKGSLARLAPAIRRELSDADSRRARAAAEAALRASEERFREMADNIGQAFWMSETDGRTLLYVSPAYERIWGRPAAEAMGRPQTRFDAVHEEDRARLQEAASRLATAGSYDETYRILRPDGSVRWVRDRAFPVRDGLGRVCRIAGVAEDVTELKETEAALRRSEEQLRHAQKMEAIGRLAGGVAHDFNNLLTVIDGYGQLSQERVAQDDPLHADLREIRDAAERASVLTRQLLAFSRKQVLQPRVIDLNDCVKSCEGMLRRLIGADVKLEIRLGEDVGPVLSDPGQIDQVVVNLAVNARDAMPGGGSLLIETSSAVAPPGDGEDAGPSPRYACIAVTDTGSGMDEQTLARIFEPFFTTKPQGKGTGLGLSTVHGIVEQSGGRVEVRSSLGKGTTFIVLLPRAEETQAAPETAAAGPAPDARPAKILLVEDQDAVRSFVRRALERNGYEVVATRDGLEAIEAYCRPGAAFDLLLTDVVMPDMTGPAVVEALTAASGKLRVLFMSGYNDGAFFAEGAPGRDRPYLPKPFTIDALLQHVRDALDGPLHST